MFQVKDNVVYPGHGVAQIKKMVKKIVGGKVTSFFELVFLSQDMTVLIPTDNLKSIGIRPLSSSEKITDIFKMLAAPSIKTKNLELSASNWNKRNKDYQSKLRTGNLEDISEIYRDLKYISQQKELSFGEKRLLDKTEALLVEEISIVRKLEEKKAVEHLRSMFHFEKKMSYPHTEKMA